LEKKVEEQEQRIQKLESLLNCFLECGRNPYPSDREDQDTYLQIMKFKNNAPIGLNKCNVTEDDNSTHSSMPGLTSVSDLSECDERIKNSYELCGNE
jgi:hypothetical protein